MGRMLPRVISLAVLASCLTSSLYAQLPNNDYPGQEVGELLDHTSPEMGRLAVIEILGDYVITIPEMPSSPPESDFIVRAWDMSNPRNPVEVGRFGETTHPFNAHGMIKRENEILLNPYSGTALRLNPDNSLSLAPWSGPGGTANKGGMMRPWGGRVWWSYDSIDGLAWLSLDNQTTAEWDHLGQTGVIGMPNFMGNIMLYASDQSMTGVAAYDISDPTDPRLLDVLTLPDLHPTMTVPVWTEDGEVQEPAVYGLGGYWAEISGHYLVFARRGENPGVQVVDFSDPSNLQLQCDFFVRDPQHADNGTPMPDIPDQSDPMYVGFQDNFVFAGMHKVDIETCEQDIFLDETGTNNDGSERYVDTSQYARPLGNLVLTGGLGPKWFWPGGTNGAGMGVWVHQASRDTNPPTMSYHIPADGQTGYPVMAPISLSIPETLRSETMVAGNSIRLIRVDDNSEVAIDYVLSHTGMLTVDPLDYLETNTTYEMQLSGIEDAAGNAMPAYSFRFSTGASIDDGDVDPPPPPPVNNPPAIDSVLRPGGQVLVGNSVNLTVMASDADGDALEYRYRLGSNAYSAWSSNNQFTLVFNALGSNTVTLQVRDTHGDIAAQVETFTVIDSAASVQPDLTSSQIAFDRSNRYAWVVNPDNDTMTQVTVDTAQVLAEYPVGDDPRAIAIDAAGNIWVTLHGSGAMEVYNTAGENQAMIDTGYGSAPFAIVMHPTEDEAYVSLYGSGELLRIDTNTRQITGRLELGPTARSLALSEDGNTLLATRFISAQNRGEIWQVNIDAWELSRTIPVNKILTEDTLENGRGIPNYLADVVINRDGSRAYVVGKKDNVDRGLLNSGPDLDDDNTVRTVLLTIDLNSGEVMPGQFDFDNADSPAALAFSPTGSHLFVAMQGRNEVFAVSVNDDNLNLEAQFTAGLAPQAVYMDADNARLLVKNFMGRSVGLIDVEGFLDSGSINPDITHVDTVANETLTPEVLAGKILFYNAADGVQDNGEFTGRMSAEGYLSCATCHLDGGHDGRTYDFTGRGEGLRNNISLKGRGGVRFGNVHWTGNFDEIHDFENDIRLRFLGRGLMSDSDFAATENPLGASKAGLSQDLDNLAAYVSSLGRASLPASPHRAATGALTQAAQRGQTLFQDQGCGDCHRDKAFTDGVIHDVGSQREYSGNRLGGEFIGLKTPSLLSAFDTSPYLHDGSAPTLADVFIAAGGTVYQAEDLSHSGTAVNSDDGFSYLRGGAGVRLSPGESITVNHDFSSAGQGTLAFRYGSTDAASSIDITLGGQTVNVALDRLPAVQTQDVNFSETKVLLDLPGGVSDITLTFNSANADAGVLLDDVTVADAERFNDAAAHTRAAGLSDAEQNDLVAFLRQIDRNNAPEDGEDVVLGPLEEEQEEEEQEGDDNNGDTANDDGSSGGGSTGFLTLVLLAILALVRRYTGRSTTGKCPARNANLASFYFFLFLARSHCPGGSPKRRRKA